MKKFLLVPCLLFMTLSTVYAADTDTLLVQVNKKQFHPGDTLSFSCQIPAFARDSIVGTLHLILENITPTAAGDIVIRSSMAPPVATLS